MHDLAPGMLARAEWWDAQPPGTWSLSGVQAKATAVPRSVEGVVTRIRGNHPTSPTSVGVWIRQDDGREVTVDLRHIVSVEDGKGK